MGYLLDSSRFMAWPLKEFGDIIAELQKTGYQSGIGVAIVTDLTMEGVDDALRQNLAKDLSEIRSFFGGEGKALIDVILASWDIHNVKTVLRGKSVAVGERDILSAVIPAGHIGDNSIRELARQPDIKGVIDLLVTWRDPIGKVLNRNLDSYMKGKDLSVFEHAIDEYYYGEALRVSSKPTKSGLFTREFIRLKIDISNLITLLKSVREAVPTKVTSALFFDGGLHISGEWLVKQNEKADIKSVFPELRKTYYGFALKNLSPDISAVERIMVEVEEALNGYLVKKMVKLKFEDPFTIAPALSYIHSKINEIKNLRVIIRGKVFGLPPEKIERELLYV